MMERVSAFASGVALMAALAVVFPPDTRDSVAVVVYLVGAGLAFAFVAWSRPASAIDALQRPDTEEWLDPKGESAAPQEDAQTKSLYSLKDVG